ncbi:MAG TPA: glycosyltransferase family 9 protein [Bacteroidota bacterium]|nr:glycosyltransferase family 9 protein [Bacteroidota bacterium]
MSVHYDRILLTRLKFIGDIVLTTPLIHTVRDAFPNAYIAYLGEKNGVSLLEHNPYLDELFTIDLSRNAGFQQLQLFYRLNRKRFDLVVDLFCNPRSALLSYATRASVRVGGDLPGRGKLYTVRIKDDGTPKSAVEFHYQSLKAAGIEPKYFAPEIFLTEDERKESKRYLEWQGIDFSRPLIALHPGGTWPAKLWPAERFADLADLLTAKLHAQVIVTRGPQDGQTVHAVGSGVVGGVLTLPVLPLRQLAAILSLCSAYVANDSGPMHIAAAVGTPTIGIFGPGEENIWFPYTPAFPGGSAKNLPLRKDVPCHPCHLNVCNRAGEEYMECMKLLSVSEVFNAVKARI